MPVRPVSLSFLLLAACAVEPTGGRAPSQPGHDAEALAPVADLTTATWDVASTFLDARAAEVGWFGAELGESWLVYGPDGAPAYEEFAVEGPSGAAGLIDVAMSEAQVPVLAFSGEGIAPAEALLAEVDGAASWELRSNAGGDLAVVATVGEQTRFVSGLAGELVAAEFALRFDVDHALEPTDAVPVDDQELAALWSAYEDGPSAVAAWFDGERASIADDGSLDRGSRAVGRGAADFPSWSQPSKSWWPWSCAVGCTPLAAATLLAHYDGRGYGNAMPGHVMSAKVTSKDVRNVLNHLRGAMGTYCSGGQGITNYGSNVKDAIFTYMATRGYRWAMSGYTPGQGGKSLWSRLRNQISNQRPVLLHWKGNPVGHSVVVYEYEENSGSSNDWICMKWGDGGLYRCENRKTRSWVGLTRVKPS